jgi:hypothetical protein
LPKFRRELGINEFHPAALTLLGTSPPSPEPNPPIGQSRTIAAKLAAIECDGHGPAAENLKN